MHCSAGCCWRLVFGLVTVVSAVLASSQCCDGWRRAVQLAGTGRNAAAAIPAPDTITCRTREIEGAWARMAKMIEDAGLNLADTNSERLTEKLRCRRLYLTLRAAGLSRLSG